MIIEFIGKDHPDGDSESDSENEIGGLFRIAKHEQEKTSNESDNGVECSKFVITVVRDWTDEKVRDIYFFMSTHVLNVEFCFVLKPKIKKGRGDEKFNF